MTTAEQRRMVIAEELRPHLDSGIKTPEQVRALVSAIWDTAHNEGIERELMLMDLSMLSGMACAVLTDYARRLEEDEK